MAEESTIYVLVGNKSDLPNKEVPSESILQFCEENHLTFYETSALDGNGIQELFLFVAQQIENNPLSSSADLSQKFSDIIHSRKNCC